MLKISSEKPPTLPPRATDKIKLPKLPITKISKVGRKKIGKIKPPQIYKVEKKVLVDESKKRCATSDSITPSHSKMKTLGNLDHLRQINETALELAQSNRAQWSRERRKLSQKISSNSSTLHSAQLVGLLAIAFFSAGFGLANSVETSKGIDKGGDRILSLIGSYHQTRIKELELLLQTEQERIQRSREDERASQQRFEQYMQSDHNSKLRFFS